MKNDEHMDSHQSSGKRNTTTFFHGNNSPNQTSGKNVSLIDTIPTANVQIITPTKPGSKQTTNDPSLSNKKNSQKTLHHKKPLPLIITR